ncbi:MAG TPA: hypothetical protein VGQ90_07975 [Stellaceae bacterium]|jgi:hypothetical protein|nr:hypothetical protein [Stellaceae bacterium]
MLTLRTHALITTGIFAAIVVLAMLGNALEATGAVRDVAAARLTAMVVFLVLSVALAVSAVPLIVKLVLGFQIRTGGAGHPLIAALIARERAIVFALWALIALGLIIAVPAAIIDGAFD